MSGDVVVYHGDGLEIIKTLNLPYNCALVTDPPYGLGDRWHDGGGEWPLLDPKELRSWDAVPLPWIPGLVEKFPYAIVWGGQYYPLPPSRGWLVWDKIVRNFTSGHCDLAWTNLDQPIRAFNFAHGQLAFEGKYHPTQKPLKLMIWCLSFLPKDCVVLDPCAGSGTTGVACLKTGRCCILIEKDERYIPIIRRRLKEAETPLFKGL